jgi:hypothetical protein
MAGMYGTGVVPGYAGLPGYAGMEQLAMPKEAVKFEYPPGMTILGAKDAKMSGLYYQAIQPATAASYGQAMVLNQSLKRPLEGIGVAHTIDKRIKYF